jgi:NAD(P)-dependent dehydrogenase (short-subunit alcohol dehydrogenase family)
MTGQQFSGQGVVVVGAADGIGRATAALLASRGARIAALDRNLEGCSQTLAGLDEQAPAGVAVRVDVTDPASVAAALAEAEDRLGGMSVLVNCAGTTGVTNRLSEDVDLDDWDLVHAVNLRGAFLLSKAAIPGMVQRGYGRVLHVASIAGKEGNAGMVAYSASKAGLIGMVKAQGKEYATTGVTINALAPAVIRTAMVDAMPDEQVQYMTEKIPMRRTGSLMEAAEMIAWIVSPACSFTTGAVFDLSGGRAVY